MHGHGACRPVITMPESAVRVGEVDDAGGLYLALLHPVAEPFPLGYACNFARGNCLIVVRLVFFQRQDAVLPRLAVISELHGRGHFSKAAILHPRGKNRLTKCPIPRTIRLECKVILDVTTNKSFQPLCCSALGLKTGPNNVRCNENMGRKLKLATHCKECEAFDVKLSINQFTPASGECAGSVCVLRGIAVGSTHPARC